MEAAGTQCIERSPDTFGLFVGECAELEQADHEHRKTRTEQGFYDMHNPDVFDVQEQYKADGDAE